MKVISSLIWIFLFFIFTAFLLCASLEKAYFFLTATGFFVFSCFFHSVFYIYFSSNIAKIVVITRRASECRSIRDESFHRNERKYLCVFLFFSKFHSFLFCVFVIFLELDERRESELLMLSFSHEPARSDDGIFNFTPKWKWEYRERTKRERKRKKGAEWRRGKFCGKLVSSRKIHRKKKQKRKSDFESKHIWAGSMVENFQFSCVWNYDDTKIIFIFAEENWAKNSNPR